MTQQTPFSAADGLVRVYPADAAAPRPTPGLVWAHGGGFVAGDLDMPEADWLARTFAARGVTVVSIDGTRDALQAIIDGKLGVTVESSPFFGPLSCETMKMYAAGETIEPWVKVEDRIFNKENAADNLAGAY